MATSNCSETDATEHPHYNQEQQNETAVEGGKTGIEGNVDLTPENSSGSNKNTCLYRILALYHFVKTQMTEEQVKALKQDILNTLLPYHVRGSILLAREGINGTICYPINIKTGPLTNSDHADDHDGDAVRDFLLTRFPKLRTRLSYYHEPVFARFKVRIKKEIVTMGVVDDETDNMSQSLVEPACRVGEYVTSTQEWDALLRDPNCLVIDTRNDYEYQLGTFENAVNPCTTSFSEFPSWIRKELVETEKPPEKIAMFCTGGIRCEKATSYVMSLAESRSIPVYHLKGGILAYLDAVPNEQESTFKGECFVFDGRTAVKHGLQASDKYRLCHACRHALTTQDRSSPEYQLGVSCPYCCQDESRRRQRYIDRQVQIELHQSRNIPHIHDAKEKNLAHGSTATST